MNIKKSIPNWKMADRLLLRKYNFCMFFDFRQGTSIVDFLMGILISIAFMLVVAKFAIKMYYTLH